MPELSSDPALLFTPDLSSSLSEISDHSRSPSPKEPCPSRGFHISVPSLPRSEKEKYKGRSESTLTDEVGFDSGDVDQVIGEYAEKDSLYYFARFQDGTAHRFLAEAFKASFGHLVQDYERKKAEGDLAPFDPSAQYVHPASRITTVISINKNRSSIKISSKFGPLSKQKRDMEVTYDSEDDSSEEISEDYDDYSEEDIPRLRRSTRAMTTKKPVKSLPFSPRKTRSRKVFIVEDSDEESRTRSASEDDSEEGAPARRSTRNRKGTKTYKEGDDDFLTEEEVDDDVDMSNKPRPRPKKKIIRRAAYGHIRSIKDLKYDSHSDAETAPLRVHRSLCEKCHRRPAHELLAAEKKKPGKKKRVLEEFEEPDTDEEKLVALGGWLRCLKCPVVAHWRCLATTQRDEILKAAQENDRALLKKDQSLPLDEGGEQPESRQLQPGEPTKRLGLQTSETTEFICGACMKGGICMGCFEVALEPDANSQSKDAGKESSAGVGISDAPKDQDIDMTDGTHQCTFDPPKEAPTHSSSRELFYRCLTCKRLAHYRCLPQPPSLSSPVDSLILADHYQSTTNWLCANCFSYTYGLDLIIAWRPYPPNATEPPIPADEPPNYKRMLPREYLVKWTDRSYRRVQWVPHMWLLSTHPAKLKNFLSGGPKIELLAEAMTRDAMTVANGVVAPTFEIGEDDLGDSTAKPEAKTPVLPSDPIPDAELMIPPAWKTVNRVLDILLWYPEKRKARELTARNEKKKRYGRAKRKRKVIVNSEEDELTDPSDQDGDEGRMAKVKEEHAAIFAEGEQPSEDLTESLEEYEERTRKPIEMKDMDRVVWAFIKWDDMGYDQATWDSPPRPGEFGHSAFEAAFKRFIASRNVTVPLRNKKEATNFDNRPKDEFRRKYLLRDDAQPDLGQSSQLKLMPFQIDGFNWLNDNWWNHQHCILADEMGLGKTVQLATFIGNVIKRWEAYPVLIVVPNSTVTNWVREIERWAPELRVVPFYGEAKAREVIKQFELSHHKKTPGTTGAKFHVLVTTYQCVNIAKEFNAVFVKQPRWEVLVVDEGQRLKNDSNLLFKKLNELKTFHRIIMTGTPLNNNIRELFNLMNFLDPNEWRDLENLEKEYEELNEDLIKQLHTRLRPYFLRRIKSEVLQLPPKNEVIVPVSMTPLQKEVYRSILSQNVAILASLAQPSTSKTKGTKIKANVHNILMQLRKCLQHPYLYARDIEPAGLSEKETHEKLIDASAKLRLLQILLPKLKARGHRVLLFSQFVIALNVIEDFLDGEGIKHLRLDGSTKQSDRQRDMDEFNRPGSDVFIYLLSTRAGGVGINLWSADTVIVFDPDFNPHMDLQAIARAHRYGQTKTCLVFKLMVKASAEERIIQTGKKKMVLDHLIVQKMDDEDSAGENLQSMLTFGAQALFDESQGDQDITYTEHDIEKLIEKTEKEGDQEESAKEQGAFSFAKIWAAEKDSFEEVADETPDVDSWAQTLQHLATVQVQRKAQEVTGRGVRRRAAVFPQQNLDLDDSPEKTKSKPRKQKSKSKSVVSEDSAYSISAAGSDKDSDKDSDSAEESNLPLQELVDLSPDGKSHKRRSTLISEHDDQATRLLSTEPARYHPHLNDSMRPFPIPNYSDHNGNDDADYCGMCGKTHPAGVCFMTASSDNLAEYRYVLLTHAEDEPFEDRLAAIQAIDATLAKRKRLDLIVGQPLQLVQKNVPEKIKKIKMPKLPKPPKPPKPPRLHDGPVLEKAAKSILHPFAGNGIQTIPPSKPVLPATMPNVEGLSRGSASTFPVPPPSVPTAGPSKRASPFNEDLSRNKKSRQTDSSSCPICERTPRHLIKDCPVVTAGAKSVSREIKRLDSDPSMSGTVDVLRTILKKQKKKELALEQQQTSLPINTTSGRMGSSD